MPIRIVFMGTAELACASLIALRRSPGFEVVAVVTQPDRPSGRHLQPKPSPVKMAALAEGLPVLQPLRARDESFISELRSLKPDLIVVAAYGQILPAAILEMSPHGCINVHTSLLPKYRGASPIQSAILNDEAETGVTIMQIDAGLDTGPILTWCATPIQPDDNAATLHDRLAQIGAELLVRTIPDYVSGKIQPQPQPDSCVSVVKKIKKEDGLLDWNQPARQLWNRIRAFTPWPGAYTYLPGPAKARLLKIWRADVTGQKGAAGEILAADKNGLVVGCGIGALRITELQLEGGRRLAVGDFLAGHDLVPGLKLG